MRHGIGLLICALAGLFFGSGDAGAKNNGAEDRAVIAVSTAGSPWQSSEFPTTNRLLLVIYNDGLIIAPNPAFLRFAYSPDFYGTSKRPHAFKIGHLKAAELKSLRTDIDVDLHDFSDLYDGCAMHPDICFPDLNPPGSKPPFVSRIRPTDQNDQILIEYLPVQTGVFRAVSAVGLLPGDPERAFYRRVTPEKLLHIIDRLLALSDRTTDEWTPDRMQIQVYADRNLSVLPELKWPKAWPKPAPSEMTSVFCMASRAFPNSGMVQMNYGNPTQQDQFAANDFGFDGRQWRMAYADFVLPGMATLPHSGFVAAKGC